MRPSAAVEVRGSTWCVTIRCVEHGPTAKELRGAAAVAHSLAYVVGGAGVVAGAVLFRDGQTVLAVVAWVLTFAAGAALMIAALLARAVAVLLVEVRTLTSELSRSEVGPPPRDPWSRHPPPY